MSKIEWDKTGEKVYELGTNQGVLFVCNNTGAYGKGVAWNGLTSVEESPEGGEPNAQYADNIKYLNIVSLEEYKATITAYTYPDEFEECDGSKTIASGITVGQQNRRMFGFSYRTNKGNDTEGMDYGYKIHLVYGCNAAPSSKNYETVNDSPEGMELSWEVSTTPVEITEKVNGEKLKPTSHLVFDSTKIDADVMKQIEDIIYGSETTESRLPLPDEIIALVNSSSTEGGSTTEGGSSTEASEG